MTYPIEKKLIAELENGKELVFAVMFDPESKKHSIVRGDTPGDPSVELTEGAVIDLFSNISRYESDAYNEKHFPKECIHVYVPTTSGWVCKRCGITKVLKENRTTLNQ